MTHQSVTDSELEVPRDLVRISVGIEDIEDLLADIDTALEAVAQA
jgi:cystathionine gamma-synthase